MKAKSILLLSALFLLVTQGCTASFGPDQVATGVAGTLTALPSPTTPATQPADSPDASKPKTMLEPSPAPSQLQPLAPEPMANAPYPGAPLCADSGEAHDNSLFHTLWDSARGCHYDHEHGQNSFTPEVAAAFPGFDLRALIGGVGVGHTNPSSPMENTHKHGGFKWDVVLSHTTGCEGAEGATIGVDALVIQYHNFGNYAVEFETRIHSALGMLRQCLADNPTDYGYVFVNQHQDYGQRTAPYQGVVLPYPDTPSQAYDSGLKPYFFVECTGGISPCDKYPTLENFLSSRENAGSTWVSEPNNLGDSGSPLFGLLFQIRDTYQILDWNDQTYPFTFLWLCSSDGGLTYNPAGCRYNNSTTQVAQIAGRIPAEWDNLANFDDDSRLGRITAEGYVTRFGELNLSCTAPGPDCHPIKMVQAFVGHYGTFIVNDKVGATNPPHLPERDIYFCGDLLCAEGDPGAMPSGWIGQNN